MKSRTNSFGNFNKRGIMISVFSAIFVLALATSLVLADLGDGVVLSYKPNVVSTGDDVTLEIEFKNDATNDNCIDEIVITPPDTWGGQASVDKYDRSSYSYENKEDVSCNSLADDDQSVIIYPTHSLCPGETVNIEISGLTAPTGYEVSQIKIMTSDLTHNSGPSCIRQDIDVFPEIYVTHATKLKLEYFHITDFSNTGFKGQAWGAWARLKELAVNLDIAGPLKIEMETGSVDEVIFNGNVPAGQQWLVMDYSGWDNVAHPPSANLQNGYLGDQATPRNYYITYGGNVGLLGSRDETLDDEKLTDSGLVGARGTIITAGSGEQRKIVVQLTDDNDYDVNEVIPLEAMTDMGTIVEAPPYTTDSDGNALFTLLPDCEYGVAEVDIYTDPLATVPGVTEYVGINAGPAFSYAVTEGKNVNVPAGESQLIEVTVYDECGNKITNTDQVRVYFDYLTTDCSAMNKLAQAPDGPSHDHEEELTDMGVAQVYLKTGCQLCTHEVGIEVEGIGSETIYLFGIPNVPVKMKVTIDEDEIEADECVEALIEVVDVCDNLVSEIPSEVGDEMEEWESIVRVSIEDPLQSDQFYYYTHILDHDFREGYNAGSYVQGKLNDGVGHVTICGCQGLGTFDVVAISDTIDEGRDTVSVVNTDPDCIEIETVDQLLLCEREAQIDIAIKDRCGNYWRNQGCGGGEANYCVDLDLGGTCMPDGAHLSTYSVCVPVGDGDPGFLENPVTLYRDTDDCCQLEISAEKGTGCCEPYPILPLCYWTDPYVPVLFHGEPSYMTTEFYKTRKLCDHMCPDDVDCIEQNGVYCWEQLHEAFDMESATETVSEEVLDLFTVYDECGHVVKDYDGTIDVKKENEDCASIYQVDHPLELEGGWCIGHVDCKDLTQFGEEKCEETPYLYDRIRDEIQAYCRWMVTSGHCEGTPDCSVIQWPTQCTNWGCVWNNNQCGGDPDFECDDPTSPGGGHNKEICPEVGCNWIDEYSCVGRDSNMPNNCRVYTPDKEQCQMVGDAVEESCEWIDKCEFGDEILKKLVIHNCAPETEKQWLPLELDDIMVDKLAFMVNHEEDPNVWVEVWMESEWTPGFQPWEDRMVGRAPAMLGAPTIIELADSWTPYWDDQRQGGVLIRAGDSRDFYILLVNYGIGKIPCGTYDIDFLWYQDYTGPDFTDFGSGYPFRPADNGNVRDGFINSDNFNYMDGWWCGWVWPCDSRNDDYMWYGPYPGPTPDYGFGDVYIDDLKFYNGQAWTKQRDLTAEKVYDWVLDVNPSGAVCDYSDAEIHVTPQPENITFVAQPATQVKLLNHDMGETKIVRCVEEDLDTEEETDYFVSLNLQITDGFDNPVDKSVDIKLDYCLKWPFGSEFIEYVKWKFCIKDQLDREYCKLTGYMDNDYCFTREELLEILRETEIGDYLSQVLFGDYFGEEFSEWLDSYFENAEVLYFDAAGRPLPTDGHDLQYVTTDASGQAVVLATASKAGSYKLLAIPYALDADYTMASFAADIPAKLDVMALPSFGVPADGEEEALILLRALDVCGNMVYGHIHDVTVTAEGDGDNQVVISQDFECKNNYDQDVEGTLYNNFLGLTCLAVLDDYPETATITASASGLEGDTTTVAFQGAPVQLKITKIEPSDRLPADGQTGAWVWIEVQDMKGNRVTGYLGNGFSGDPGDPWGMTDYRFENICIDLDEFDPEWDTFIPDWYLGITDHRFGFTNFHQVDYLGKVYCGDLWFGEGKVYVVYGNPNCNHGGTIDVKVFDFYPYQGQEYDENGIPVSVHATQLDPDAGEIDFVDPATQWNIWSDKQIVLADGVSSAEIKVQVENPYMDVRQAVVGNVYVGGTAESGAVISWEGEYDELNPTSMRIMTDPLTGEATLVLTSTEPGIAEVTIVGGDAYTCLKMDSGWNCQSICFEECDWIEGGYELCFEEQDCRWIERGFEICAAETGCVWIAGGRAELQVACDLTDWEIECLAACEQGISAEVGWEGIEVGITQECMAECDITIDEKINCIANFNWFEMGIMGCFETEGCYYETRGKEHCESITGCGWVEGGHESCIEYCFMSCQNWEYGACPGCEKVYDYLNCHYNMKEDLDPKTITVEFIEVADEEIYLETGWNFISTPYELDVSSDTFGELLAGVWGDVLDIQGWDPVGQTWVSLGAGSAIDPLEGYWIKMGNSGVVTLVYADPAMPSIPTKDVKEGWNAVGLTWNSPMIVRQALISIDQSYSQLIGWIAGTQEYGLPIANTGGSGPMETGGASMYPKQGYWIWVTVADKLAGLTAL